MNSDTIKNQHHQKQQQIYQETNISASEIVYERVFQFLEMPTVLYSMVAIHMQKSRKVKDKWEKVNKWNNQPSIGELCKIKCLIYFNNYQYRKKE